MTELGKVNLTEMHRKDATQYVANSDLTHRYSYRLNPTNTQAHELVKPLLGGDFFRRGQAFITESQMEDPDSGRRLGRADMLNLDEGVIYEILASETEKKFQAKLTKYPLEVIPIRADKHVRVKAIPNSKSYNVFVLWEISDEAIPEDKVYIEPSRDKIPETHMGFQEFFRGKSRSERKQREYNYWQAIRYVPYNEKKGSQRKRQGDVYIRGQKDPIAMYLYEMIKTLICYDLKREKKRFVTECELTDPRILHLGLAPVFNLDDNIVYQIFMNEEEYETQQIEAPLLISEKPAFRVSVLKAWKFSAWRKLDSGKVKFQIRWNEDMIH